MEVNFPTFFLQALSFLLLIFAMKKVLYAPILAMIEKRQRESQQLIEEAERYNHNAEEKWCEIQKSIETAKGEANSLLDDAKSSAEQQKKVIIQNAKKEAQLIVAQAKSSIESQVKKIKEELRNETALFSISVAEKLLMREISYEDRKSYIQFYLKDVKKV